jgi:nitroreductase/cold shock CspA family protein
MPKGMIRRLITEHGYGFIKTEEEKDLFFHRNQLQITDYNSLREGQQVEFEIGQRPDGRLQATKVRLAAQAEPASTDILEVIKGRRSIRKYKPDPIPQEKIDKILEAGWWAPSADNSQPWTFIVLQKQETRKKLADILTWGRFLSEAALGIAVTINPSASSHPIADGAAATQNMLLEAHSLGLGACWIGIYGSSYEESAKRLLEIPEDERLLCVIAIGYPAESPQSTRRSLSEVTFTDKYGNR